MNTNEVPDTNNICFSFKQLVNDDNIFDPKHVTVSFSLTHMVACLYATTHIRGLGGNQNSKLWVINNKLKITTKLHKAKVSLCKV